MAWCERLALVVGASRTLSRKKNKSHNSLTINELRRRGPREAVSR
jgi:hypothetical protein